MTNPIEEWRKRGGRALAEAAQTLAGGGEPPGMPVAEPASPKECGETVGPSTRGGAPAKCGAPAKAKCRSCLEHRCADHLYDGCDRTGCAEPHRHDAGQCSKCFSGKFESTMQTMTGRETWSDRLREAGAEARRINLW